MPLQNRVTPFGALAAVPERGTLMGNRGGRIHDERRRILGRPWTSRRWIACELAWKEVRRTVMGEGYTELFFLDEVTALAAGHRPCFYCRRGDALAFAACCAPTLGEPPTADAMDLRLHAERLDRHAKRRHRRAAEALPDGAVIAEGDDAFALSQAQRLRWTPDGWQVAGPRPAGTVEVLTPPLILAALEAGYKPRWHGSAGITPTTPQRSAC
jgi:hypothetical protein